LEICKLQSSYMFKVALATTVCYDKSCINYKKLEIKTLQFHCQKLSVYTFMTLWQEHEKLVSVLEPRIL
jgi:hypothetical protein